MPSCLSSLSLGLVLLGYSTWLAVCFGLLDSAGRREVAVVDGIGRDIEVEADIGSFASTSMRMRWGGREAADGRRAGGGPALVTFCTPADLGFGGARGGRKELME